MTETAEIRLQWLIDVLQDPSSLTVADIESAYDVPKEWRDWTPEREIDFLTNGPLSGSRPFTVQRVTLGERHSANAIVVGADGKRFTVTCWSEPEPPHRLTDARLAPAGPDGMEIRLATADDSAVLAELERRAPLRLGTDPLTFMTFDRGDDFFAPSRLMEEETIYVAEHEGRIVGVYGGAVQPVEVDGETKRLFLEHHVRIDPEAPRGGVFWALCAYGRERYARSTDSIAFYVSVDNHALRKLGNLTPGWSPQPERKLLPCSPTGSTGDVARSATAADAQTIVDVLNGCHGGAALFAPYTVESLTARLTRDPSQYGWEDFAIGRGAVIGVGRGVVNVTKECEGNVDVTRRAVAIDHGFLPGHEDDYRDLLGFACSQAARRGATHLTLFTSARSATYDVISELADTTEAFDFWAFDIPEPATALAEHGFYVDPVYF